MLRPQDMNQYPGLVAYGQDLRSERSIYADKWLRSHGNKPLSTQAPHAQADDL